MKGYPRRNKNVGTYYINGILSDVTAVKKAEDEAELQRREIARLMRQSVLGELSGAIAHELNQPLTAILVQRRNGTGSPRSKQIDLEKIQEIVSDIIEEDNRASEVISRIRKLLRKGERKSEIIDLNQLVNSTVNLLRGEFVRRKTNIDVVAGRELAEDFRRSRSIAAGAAQCDHERYGGDGFERTVRNAKLRSRLVPMESKFEAVIVDSGHGIAAEDQTRLFQPFFTTKEHGLGLGLSICSTIVKSHGGKLSIENNTGGGATVSGHFADPRHTLVPA